LQLAFAAKHAFQLTNGRQRSSFSGANRAHPGNIDSYRDAYASRRLIVPVSGFYEWKRDGAHKQPFAIRYPDHSPLAFAGLWGTWHDLDTFTIVTTEANAAMCAVHDRLPLILSPDQFDEWLDPENPDPQRVLTSTPQEELELVPVSDWGNKARHKGLQCLAPA
jgi:putative SOS response-associated peptidase YedK